jgi:immune inhibitor A
VTNVTTGGTLSLPDVKTSRNVHRLWKDGAGGSEYFLLENRHRTGFDAQLPGDGLLIWHIDESQPGNTDENHYKVALMQADGKRDLELDHNRGDAGDPYPGSSGNTAFSASSTPNSKSYAGADTCVSVAGISASGGTMSAMVAVHCGKAVVKDLKDVKEVRKDTKELTKDRKDAVKEGKESTKDRKEAIKDIKERKERAKDRKDSIKEVKEQAKDRKDIKDRVEAKSVAKDVRDTGGGKGHKELVELPGGGMEGGDPGDGGFGLGGLGDGGLAQALADMDARLAALEAAAGLSGQAEPFIGSELRPDLVGGVDYAAHGDLQQRMAAGDRDAKIAFDTLP